MEGPLAKNATCTCCGEPAAIIFEGTSFPLCEDCYNHYHRDIPGFDDEIAYWESLDEEAA